MTTEEKAKAYAESIIESFGDNGVPCGIKDIQQLIAEAYLAGAAEALSSQWKKTSMDLPKDNEEVIICTSMGSQVAYWDSGCQCWKTNHYMYSKDDIVYWMSIPGFTIF